MLNREGLRRHCAPRSSGLRAERIRPRRMLADLSADTLHALREGPRRAGSVVITAGWKRRAAARCVMDAVNGPPMHVGQIRRSCSPIRSRVASLTTVIAGTNRAHSTSLLGGPRQRCFVRAPAYRPPRDPLGDAPRSSRSHTSRAFETRPARLPNCVRLFNYPVSLVVHTGAKIPRMATASFLLLLGCNAITGLWNDRDVTASFQTHHSEYRWEEVSVGDAAGLKVNIPFTYTNQRDDTIYIANCEGRTPKRLEMMYQGRWRNVFSPIVGACDDPAITIPPRQTYTVTIVLLGLYPSHGIYPQFETTELDGLFRISWGPVYPGLAAYHRRDEDERVPIRQRRSNVFRLIQP
jgi:hypothetical protein